jgi:hypothetical protein
VVQRRDYDDLDHRHSKTIGITLQPWIDRRVLRPRNQIGERTKPDLDVIETEQVYGKGGYARNLVKANVTRT